MILLSLYFITNVFLLKAKWRSGRWSQKSEGGHDARVWEPLNELIKLHENLENLVYDQIILAQAIIGMLQLAGFDDGSQ